MKRIVLLSVIVPSLAVRRLDLTATSGETSGKYAFEGGEPEATCKACKAVMEHVQRRVEAPMYDEFFGRERKGKMGVDSGKLNKIHRIGEVLDPAACRAAMQSYDLAYVGGENTFQYKDPKYGAGAPYPIHMELNDWAKNELGSFCESLIEEYEDDLTALLSDEDEDKAALPDKVCKHKLALCVPPPPPPPPKKEKKKSRKARLAEARKVFESFDTSGASRSLEPQRPPLHPPARASPPDSQVPWRLKLANCALVASQATGMSRATK